MKDVRTEPQKIMPLVRKMFTLPQLPFAVWAHHDFQKLTKTWTSASAVYCKTPLVRNGKPPWLRTPFIDSPLAEIRFRSNFPLGQLDPSKNDIIFLTILMLSHVTKRKPKMASYY